MNKPTGVSIPKVTSDHAHEAIAKQRAMTPTPMPTEREDEAGPSADQIEAACRALVGPLGYVEWDQIGFDAKPRFRDAMTHALLAARISPAPTGAGEAEKLADERAIALIIHEECGGTVLIAGWANRAAKRIAALRRAQPPQQTGADNLMLDRTAVRSIICQIPNGDLAAMVLKQIDALPILGGAQSTGDAEGLSEEEIALVIAEVSGCGIGHQSGTEWKRILCDDKRLAGDPNHHFEKCDCRLSARAVIERVNSRTPKTVEWECFPDPCYFDMWAVRPKGEREFTRTIHVANGDEARELVRLLSACPLSTGAGEKKR
jgi:hypothetical protein